MEEKIESSNSKSADENNAVDSSDVNKHKKLLSKPSGKIAIAIILVILGLTTIQLFSTAVVANLMYKGKSFPNLSVADESSGSRTFTDVSQKLADSLNASQARLIVDDQSEQFSPSQLGVSINQTELERTALKRDLKRLLTPLFLKDSRSLPLSVDVDELNKNVSKAYESKGFKTYTNASFTVKDSKLITQAGKDGIGIKDEPLVNALEEHYQNNLKNIEYKTIKSPVSPAVSEADIKNKEATIVSFTMLNFSLTDGTKKLESSESDKASWLIVNKEADQVVINNSEKQIKNFVSKGIKQYERSVQNEITTKYLSGRDSTTTKGSAGREVSNAGEIEKGLISAVSKKTSYTGVFSFKNIPFAKESRVVDDRANIKIYTYEVVKWGNIQSNLEEFATLAAQTYSDSRGWSQGDVVFKRVASGGNFTLVLSSPERVAAASPGCSSEYSCNVGRYVIINDARWRGATSPWNAAGGSLRDYRHMVVNHETGHWLGFGHRYCSGAGQKAPVMQQQSISLQGCTFNAWPTSAEISSL